MFHNFTVETSCLCEAEGSEGQRGGQFPPLPRLTQPPLCWMRHHLTPSLQVCPVCVRHVRV